MDYMFRKDIKTTVSTWALIEDCQALMKAIKEEDWSQVATVMECLADSIESGTIVPAGLNIKPSVSSLIAPSCEEGIIMDGCEDVKCANGNPISFAMSGGVLQCSESCPFFSECRPEEGEFQFLINGKRIGVTYSSKSDAILVQSMNEGESG